MNGCLIVFRWFPVIFFFSLVTFFFAVTTSTQRHKSRNTNIQESQDLKSKQHWDVEYSYSTLGIYDITFRSSEKNLSTHWRPIPAFSKQWFSRNLVINSQVVSTLLFKMFFKLDLFLFLDFYSLSLILCVYIYMCVLHARQAKHSDTELCLQACALF